MEIKINDNLVLTIEDKNKGNFLTIKTIKIKNKEFSVIELQKIIKNKIENQIYQEFNDVVENTIDNTDFYIEKVYPSFYSVDISLDNYIKNAYFEISFEKILSGQIIIIKDNDIFERELSIRYNLVEDKLHINNLLDKVCNNKYHLLALEQYKRGKATKEFTELVNTLKYFKGKKSINIILEDDSKIKYSNFLSMYFLKNFKKNIKGFEYRKKIHLIDHELIKKALSY